MPSERGGTAPTISPGREGPSIGAPAGTGEQLLAVPAGVDGLLVATGWEGVIDELEARLAAWRAALRGAGSFPDDFRWPERLGDCPGHLHARARAILAAQRDVEDELTARRAALGALLHGIGTTERRLPVPLFVDQLA
ncbi:MAG: hypothetical protein ACRDYZ_08735 [Acidimicrobiales bacterium]